jgi:hypothetical protein
VEKHDTPGPAKAASGYRHLRGPLDANARRESLHNYEHKKLIEAIVKLDEVPEDPQAFSEWIQAEAHLSFLRQNARADELVIYASGEYTFINTVAVPNDRLTPIDREDLMGWSFNPYTSIASYVVVTNLLRHCIDNG